MTVSLIILVSAVILLMAGCALGDRIVTRRAIAEDHRRADARGPGMEALERLWKKDHPDTPEPE